MAERDQLADRLYSKKQTPKNARCLRPRDPRHIGPTLMTPRVMSTAGRDTPNVPSISLTGDQTARRPGTALGEDRGMKSPISVRRVNPSGGQGNATERDSKRPQTALQSARQPIPRARPPQLVPMEIRPTGCGETRFGQTPRTPTSPIGQTTRREDSEVVFRLKKSNIAAQGIEEFETFKRDPTYTPDISDELWNDPSMIFYYIRLIKQQKLDEEFLYFRSQPATRTEPENVYFLCVMPPANVNWDDYYTLSKDGVASYRKSKGEFHKLEKWLRDCTNYIKAKKIMFFGRYDQWRSFTLMRRITQCQLISVAKTQLSSIYFNVDFVMQKALLNLQVCCRKMLKLSLIDVKSSQTITLKNFVERQYAHEEKVVAEIQQLMDAARMGIVRACDATYESTGSSHDTKPKKEVKEVKVTKAKELAKRAQTALSGKGRAQEKKKKPTASSEMMVYTQLATQRFCYKRLSRYIRLCDYMLIHTLYTLVVESCGHLVDFLAPRSGASGGDVTRLSTEVIIENDQLAFIPSQDTMLASINEAWTRLVATIICISPFSLHQSLSQYSSSYGWTEPVTPLSKIINADMRYQSLTKEMNDRIRLAFTLATENVMSYQPQLEAYLRNCQFDVQAIQESDPPASFYDDSLANYRTEIKTMDSLARSQQVHMLLVQLASFCDTIKPSPRKCLEQLNALIPCIAESKVDKIAQRVIDSLAILHDDPNDVHVFVSQLEFRRKLNKEFDAIREDYKDAAEFYVLIEKDHIAAGEDAVASYKALSGHIQDLETLAMHMSDEEEIKIRKWTQPLQVLVGAVRKDLLEVHQKTGRDDVMSMESSPDEMIRYLTFCQGSVNELRERAEQIQKYQRAMQQKVSAIDELTTTSTDLNLKILLWTSWKEWKAKLTEWTPTAFKALDVEDLGNLLQKFTRATVQISSGLGEHPLAPVFKSAVQALNEVHPILVALLNPHLQASHWTKIETISGIQKLEESNYSLGYLLERRIGLYVDAIESVANDASNEASLLTMLHEIETTWENIEFTMVLHKDIKDFFLVGDMDDIVAQLEETQVQLSTIRSSRYVGAIKGHVDDISKSMNLLAKCLDDVALFQIAFNSLSKVFSSGDIQREMATEAKELVTLERQYKAWGLHARDVPKVFKLCASEKAVNQFEAWIESTENIQKALKAFLQKKRTAFPRFYFLSNENLLRIFAEARNPKSVQPFLPKLFDGIHTLEFAQTGQDILAMNSVEGESIALVKCQTLGAIEGWLNGVEKSMKLSLHRVLKEGRGDYVDMSRVEWIQKHPAQVISVISQINFALTVEEALLSGNPLEAMKEVYEKMGNNLIELADLVRCQLPRAMRSGIVALITLDVHSRDIVAELVASEVRSIEDFEWAKRLRYYWDSESNRVKMEQGSADMEYGYEYLGATGRLVVTPLTERCYLTLTSALQCYLGGSPAGPAGTGKTETVKDLAKAVGNFSVVFNCSDAVTVIQMESFFSGLAQAGAWACFDEFNRINSEVLSVIAEQVYQVQQAVAAKVQTFEFSGQIIPISPRVGVFITMNPGYAGRTELPDNLKSLFRPIAMMVPDYAMIAEVVLYSEGFNTAKPLAQKVTQLYQLSSQMLSHQSHYDWGMRALKSVLVMAGTSKRRMPTLNEDIILIRAMRDSNVSKLLVDDKKLFDAIIGDLFPGVEFEQETFEELTAAISVSVQKRGLQESEFMTIKTIQLFQTIFIRHGVMLVGPTGGGKTTSRDLLADALDVMGTPVEQSEINPKAVTLADLYGAYNLVTGDWKNGLVGKMFSEMAEADPEKKQWIVFDGPVDALWIENMNTVLDDNKLLSLANSDRIKMTDQMHLLFEVGDLAQASPATVSRCGMVYYQPEDLGWHPLVDTWIGTQPENTREHLSALFEQNFDGALATMRDSCKTVVVPIVWNLASSLCHLYDAMIEDQKVVIASVPGDQVEKFVAHMFAYAIAWAFGGIITEDTRGDFDTFLRECFERRINYPTRRTLFDYSLAISELKFTPWSDEIELKDKEGSDSAIVATSDTLRFSRLLMTLVVHKRPVIFLGESGCGKTSIIQNALVGSMNTIASILFTLSARTTAAQIQDLIESKMLQKRKTLFGPPEGKSAVLVIDDFNLPRPDEYGSQPSIEILRTVINKKGLYNRDELFWYTIDNLTIIASGMTQGFVSPRFTSRFTILSLPAPSDPVLTRIFSMILNKFLDGFSDVVREMSEGIVKASVVFYRKVKAGLLPTPSRSHYTFNLRDLSRVFQGILLTNMDSLSDPQSFVKLWFHENLRVFGDRLVDTKDRTFLNNMMFETAKNGLKVKEDVGHYFGEEAIVWTDVLRGFGNSEQGSRSYEEATSLMQLTAALTTFTDMYKSSVVLFREAIEHTLRIVRVMRQPSGHMLLVGMGGTGKRTAARFAAFVAEMEIFEPQPAKEYRVADFRNDIKGLFKTAGVQNKQIMFLMTDEQIVDEAFLEDINNVLNTGEVPGLFETEEYDQMVNELVPSMKKAGESLAYDSLCKKFTSNIMKNLHVVLALSPVGGRFRDRCRIFPALVNCCTIDWYEQWTGAALTTVAEEFIGRMELENYGDVGKALSEVATFAHTTVAEAAIKFQSEFNRVYYVTPAVYVEFFSLFTQMLTKRAGDLEQKKQQLEKGVEKLAETNSKVQDMEIELRSLRPLLQEKAVETDKLMAKLKVDREKVNEAHTTISAEEETVKVVKSEATVLAADAQSDLDKALPLLQAALEAVEDLKNRKSDLAVIKTFVKPPQLVVDVMEGVCLLMGVKTDWASAKQLLAQTDFFNRLLDVHNQPVSESVLVKIRQMSADPKFELKKVNSVSESAGCLYKWVVAIERFVTESQRIAPKQQRRDEAQAALEEAEQKLKVKQDELQVISTQLASLQLQYEESVAQQKELAQKIEQCEYRLKNASQLTTALDSEKVRWTENLAELAAAEKCILGDTLLIALHVAYIGPFSFPYRQVIIDKLIAKCHELMLQTTPDFILENVATDPVVLREWQVAGLPLDALSKQNGVLVTSTRRWPLLIDPQGQGRKWLLESGGMKLVRCDDPTYARSIENAIRLGSAVLVEDVSEVLDPGLQFILAPKLKKQSGRLMIQIGDKWVDYDPQFRLYLTTKLGNPQFLPDVFIQLSVINFSVTHEGLEDQLLSDVVMQEMPQLENQRSELIVAISQDQKTLNGLMAQILHLLFSSKGNILDNEALIATLNDAKATSIQVAERLVEAEKTEKEIGEKREVYRDVATRGSIMYFVVLELPGIDTMYQYSLEFFKRIFRGVLAGTEPCDVVATRCEMFIERLTYAVFANVSRGLFANHREVFSFLIATALLRSTDVVSDDQWKLFLRGPIDVDMDKFEDPPDGLELRIWEKCCALSKGLPVFTDFQKRVKEDYKEWEPLIEGVSMDIPKPYSTIHIFNKLIIISCVARRKVVSLVRTLVREVLGDKFVARADVDLAAPFGDTSADTPLLFILSQGADPRESLERLAEKMGLSDRLAILSLGQGRGPTAARLIKQAKKDGNWVFLQNCHLCPSFLPQLELIIQKLARTASQLHTGFRLILSSMPTDVFPISILRNSVKVTSEPPSGVQPNVSLLLNTLDSNKWETCPRIRPWKKLLFGVALFHATIRERKRYGALGFNKTYEWNTSDFSIAVKMLHLYISQAETVPWDALRQMLGDVVYGGRVTDDWDRRCMNAILDRFLCQESLNDGIFFDSDKLYPTIPLCSFAQISETVAMFPSEDSPSLFGFHPSAVNALHLHQSSQLIEWVLGVQPRDSGGSATQKDDDTVFSIVEDLSGQIPTVILTKNANPSLHESSFGDRPNSLTVVLFQEIERYNVLLAEIHASLQGVEKAIRGEVVMSIDIADVYRSLLDRQVPNAWRNMSYPSKKPLVSWCKDLVDRVDFIQSWLKKGEPNVFWFPGLFFPQSFLTAVLQNHSRKHSVPIDTLSFEARALDKPADSLAHAAEDGAYITGLFFDGARWDDKNQCLMDSDANAVYTTCPVIHIIPRVDFMHPKDDYKCPVYRTAERAGVLSTTGHSTNFVVALNLPSRQNPSHWTMRGAALLLETPY